MRRIFNMVDEKGTTNFTDKLNELSADEWEDIEGNHSSYIDEKGQIHFTLLLSKEYVAPSNPVPPPSQNPA